MFTIYRQNPTEKVDIVTFDTEEEAISLCKNYGWVLDDEDGEVWDLVIEETEGRRPEFWMISR